MENVNNSVQLDKSMILYQPTIIDEVQFREIGDGTGYYVSDIGLLKSMSSDDSNPVLAEALSMRMQIRPSTPTPQMTDDQILESLKSRGMQDPTEIARYQEAIKNQLGNSFEKADFEKWMKEQDEKKQQEVEQPKTE